MRGFHSAGHNHPVILPISGRKLKSITAGTAFRAQCPAALQRAARIRSVCSRRGDAQRGHGHHGMDAGPRRLYQHADRA
jgi:hypothetical protein